ncbi:MAG: cupredoxin domain-containing protein [Nanoarchaeota archaeon]|nr:cupredoxin domain-containing protein [Nanoarchaeota archaeon]
MQKKVLISIFLLLLLGLSLTGCSETATTPTDTTGTAPGTPTEKTTATKTPVEAPKGSATVDIIGDTFVPGTITIKTGGSVQWVNKDAAPHSVSFLQEAILDKVVKTGDNVVATFPTPGTYKYKDKFGKATGVIIVE